VSEVYPETPLGPPAVVSGPPAPPPATPGQRAYEAHAAMVVPRPWRWDQLDDKLRAAWEAAAQAVLNDAFPRLKRQLAEAREKLAATQAIARMLQATGREILAAYESGTVVSGELAGIWRERLGGDHA
jgi:hypothetical protein